MEDLCILLTFVWICTSLVIFTALKVVKDPFVLWTYLFPTIISLTILAFVPK